jgi:hypothetical protein
MPHSDYTPHFRFYLVLKGEIAIFTDNDNDCLKLLAPDIPEHAYAAGPWLGEAQIPSGLTLQLKNVQGGRKTPADYPDLLVNLSNTTAHPELARFEIDVPFPHEILAGAEQNTSSMSVIVTNPDGSTSPLPKMPKQTCLAAILVYNWDGVHAPFLVDPVSGRQWLSGGKQPLYRSLHVAAAGETAAAEEQPDHAKVAFHKAAAVLGVNAAIDFGGGGDITLTTAPPGLSFFEVNLSYFETLQLGQTLGEILEGGRSQLPDPPTTMKFLGGNCGPIGG